MIGLRLLGNFQTLVAKPEVFALRSKLGGSVSIRTYGLDREGRNCLRLRGFATVTWTIADAPTESKDGFG